MSRSLFACACSRTLVVIEEIGARVLHALIEKQAVEIVSEIVVVRDVLLCLANGVCLLEALEAARDATQHLSSGQAPSSSRFFEKSVRK